MSEIAEEKNDDIKNWYVYESYQVAIALYRQSTETGFVYNVHLSHVLELDEDEHPDKVISIITDKYGDNVIDLIKETTSSIAPLFDAIGDEVIVWDDCDEILETYSLNEMFKEKSVIISLKA
jgi:hypothetical protein